MSDTTPDLSAGPSAFPLQKPSTPEKVAQYKTWQEAKLNGVEVMLGGEKKLRLDSASSSDSESNVYDYAWPTSPEDDKFVRALLQTGDDADFESPSTWVVAPQYKCLGCGKLSGFADSVYTALVDQVHTAEFMIAAVKKGEPNKAPSRYVKCAGCGCPSPYPMGWASGFGWTHNAEKQDAA
ncbi:hypothetical protein B0T26DRAFT_754001 [Lasiosphaeria miniovina]|uniref:Uncharacterized protein n=1 Tax=Lasiosphaeria miniovina TaxID=1954250 RepID=A0AA40DRX8_9PEZI|nr:uncharacterized protein B0T26DRAFT_754001 [Lasiosphaeria miniovina]KAK0713944.1 hypothetical protein B0T26DRAFT_754001 [Lasiosphaeria miniovina]